MRDENFDVMNVGGGRHVKMWTRGVQVDDGARTQLSNTAKLPFIFKHLAAMPDVHFGKGSTIGSVIPTKGAIIPAGVGVDIGCGMMACKTTLTATDLPDNLAPLRTAIENAVPHGMSPKKHGRDKGAWANTPAAVDEFWATLFPDFEKITEKYPRLKNTNNHRHLGTLGGGNHFVEVCLDETNAVWFMLHSGSRGVGNAIGTLFIEKAKEDMRKHFINLPDEDLAYFAEGTEHYDDYVFAVGWAQRFARANREAMMTAVIAATKTIIAKPFATHIEAVNCHHNYVQEEVHFGEKVLITRKGAVRAGKGEMGIIPGSMGAKSFIVRGKGNADSFESCSHGAGRVMSRNEAVRRFTVADQIKATEGVECRKDKAVIDEIPMAYKNIDAVMHAQRDLVEVVHTLKQVVCIKG
jgi:tRNA-splicing ligase RtcB (3'-phosphate/5'-hydroxy nucleic acid ligase)